VSKPKVILQLYSGQNINTGDFYYRIEQPASALSKFDDLTVVNLDLLDLADPEILLKPDLLILHHLSDPDLLPVIRTRRERGLPVIYELADHFRYSQAHKPEFRRYGPPDYTLIMEELMRRCEAVQTNNSYLLDRYRELNDHFIILPNLVENVIPKAETPENSDRITVGWGGSARHYDDLKEFAPALMDWVRKYPTVRLAIMGSKSIQNIFQPIPRNQKLFQAAGGLAEYLSFLQQLDIGIAPLKQTEFNICRSDVKFLEYASREVVPLCGALGPYLNVGERGNSILHFSSVEELIQHLDLLFQNRELRRQIAKQALNWVQENRLSVGRLWENRADTYRELISHSARKQASDSGSREYDVEVGDALRSALKTPDTQKSLSRFHKAVQRNPQNYQAHYFYGWALSKCGRPGEAMAELTKALSIRPDSLRTILLLARVQVLSGQPEAALETVERGLNLEPSLPNLLCMKATLLQLNQRHQEAIRVLNECLEKNPDYVEAWTAYARSACILQKWADVQRSAKKLQRLIPDSPETPWLFANLYLGRRDYSAVKEQLAQALQLDPQHRPSLRLLKKVTIGKRPRQWRREHSPTFHTLRQSGYGRPMSHDTIRIFQFVSNPVCAPYRFDIPRKHLNLQDNFHVTSFRKFDRETYACIAQEADMLLVQRVMMSPAFERICSALNSLGKLVIYDIDDNLLDLPPDSRYAQRVPENYSVLIKQAIQTCQAVQCSTEALAEVIRTIHPEVVVLQNQLDEIRNIQAAKKMGGPVIIGYAAGEDHLLDWLAIKDAYNQAVEQLSSKGFETETWIIGDREIFDSIATDRKKYFPILPREKYLRLLEKLDISLLPLVDSSFNRCKSDIKFLESAAAGCAALASPHAYSDCIKHRQTGMLYNNCDEFIDSMKELTSNPKLIQKSSKNAHDYAAQNRLMCHHSGSWAATYQAWLSRSAELLSRGTC
jgi:tetratricopeptide (TPR) repeat protein